MKASKTIICAFVIISQLIVSCVNCCNNEAYAFRLRVEVVVENNQTMKLNYVNNTGNINQVTQDVIGSNQNQFIEFCLPEEPTDLTLMFNNEKEIIKIQTALLENNTYQMFIKEPERIHAYFVGNANMSFDKEQLYYKTDNIANGSNPAIKARDVLIKRLKNRLSF